MYNGQRIVRLSNVRPTEWVSTDSLRRHEQSGNGRNMSILMQAQQYWHNLRELREQGDRCLRYYQGRAWSDEIEIKVTHPSGLVTKETMTEEDYIRSQGKVPLQNNLIRRLGRNIVGLYRDSSKEPIVISRDKDEQYLGDTMSELLSYNRTINKSKGLYARGLEYFLIYGHVHHRHWFGWNKDKCDCWTERLDINRMFWDTSAERDDLSDARMIGYVHDMPIDKVCSTFAHNPQEFQRLREVYRMCGNRAMLRNQYEQFSHRRLEEFDFLTPSDPTKCRVIEVWSLEQKPRYHCHDWMLGECYKIEQSDYYDMVVAENQARVAQYKSYGIDASEVPLIETEWFMDDYWYYRFLSPTGIVLMEGETPYHHQGHPFVSKLYPMINGEVRSHVADLLDIQRMINRLITKYDWILSASAKGTLFMAEESLSDRMSIEEIADNYAKIGGIVLYKSKNGAPVPQQLTTNNTNIGILELLNIQLRFIEEISSVNSAMQGKQAYSGMSGSLYAQQTQNSTKGLLDILETYEEFEMDNARMDMKNIQQFYDKAKVISISGKDSADITLDAEKVLNVDFDLAVTESTTSPTYKERAHEFLMQLMQMGLISLEQALEVGKFPFAAQLKQVIQAQKAQIAQGETPEAMPQDVVQQAQSGANMDAVNKLYDAMRFDKTKGYYDSEEGGEA